MKFKTDIVIGMEVHVQLNTKTKLFCSCPTHGKEEPNTRTCPICLGHPGSKPAVNQEALHKAIQLALALNCSISPRLVFARKSYFYPDLAKSFQITQYDEPLGFKGSIKLANKLVGITRAHLEEDPASTTHHSTYSLLDYNRSGIPLVEVVTEPELHSPEEAREFMKKLRTILLYLTVFDPNTDVIKADANVSVKETKYTRVEIKNISGFKEIESALFYEARRQTEHPKEVVQETRGWDVLKQVTYSMRKKEAEEEYGYIIEPDLVPTPITQSLITEVEQVMPELADQKVEKFLSHGIKPEDAEVLAAERELAELYEKVAEEVDPELAAKWLRHELVRVLNYNKKSLDEVEVDEVHLISLLRLVEQKKITDKTAQKLLEQLIEKPFDVDAYVKKHNLAIVSEEGDLERFCKEAVSENPSAVEDYKKGEQKALNFIVGKVMAKTKGKADPATVNKLIKKLIA